MFGLARCFRPKATMSKNQRDTFSDTLGLGTVQPPQHGTAGGRYNTPPKTSQLGHSFHTTHTGDKDIKIGGFIARTLVSYLLRS